MKPDILTHSWNVTPQEAVNIQKKLLKKLEKKKDWEERRIKIVAGVDVSFPKEEIAKAAVVLLSFPSLKLIEVKVAKKKVEFPYIPGLLAFREGPVVLKAFEKLEGGPDLIIFDAQGLAHPRRMGLASHLGVLLNKPSIGCAKSKLVGNFGELGEAVGSTTDLVDNNEIIGKVVRSREGSPPLFVSIGNRIDLEGAVFYVLACTKKGSRLPQTAKLAHKAAAGEILEEEKKEKEAEMDQRPLFMQ